MAIQQHPIKVPVSTQRKLSMAVGLLSFAAFIIQGLGSTYGFQSIAEQLTQTFLLFSGGINIWFLGSTTQKIAEERKEDEQSQK